MKQQALLISGTDFPEAVLEGLEQQGYMPVGFQNPALEMRRVGVVLVNPAQLDPSLLSEAVSSLGEIHDSYSTVLWLGDRDPNLPSVDRCFQLPEKNSPDRLLWFVKHFRRLVVLDVEYQLRQEAGQFSNYAEPAPETLSDTRPRLLTSGLSRYLSEQLREHADVMELLHAGQMSDVSAQQDFDCILIDISQNPSDMELVRALRRDVRHVTRPALVLSPDSDISPDDNIEQFDPSISAETLISVISPLVAAYRIEDRLHQAMKFLEEHLSGNELTIEFLNHYLSLSLEADSRVTVIRLELQSADDDGLDEQTFENAFRQASQIISRLSRGVDFCTHLAPNEIVLIVHDQKAALIESITQRLTGIIETSSFSKSAELYEPANLCVETSYAIAVPGDTFATLFRRAGFSSSVLKHFE